MQVKAESFEGHLSQGDMAPIYLISGDETLLVEEACDAVIQRAKQVGFTERSVHYVESGFKWHNLANDAASLSLFAERKLLDLRVPANKFDRTASDEIKAWCEQAQSGDQDAALLIRTTRLQPRQRSSAWFKAIDALGVVVLIWPVEAKQLPRWLQQRAAQRSLQLEADALQYLSDRVEGNLLAAAQEIEKLSMMGLAQPITVEHLISALEDTSRYNSFDVLDAMMMGDAARIVKTLAALRDEGVSLFAILGALTSQLRRGDMVKGLPPARQRLVQQFYRRVRNPEPALSECALIDQQGKGMQLGDPWQSLENLLLRLGGVRELPLPSETVLDR